MAQIRLLSEDDLNAWEALLQVGNDNNWTQADIHRAIATIRHLKEQDSLGQIMAMQQAFRERLNDKLGLVNPEDVWDGFEPGEIESLDQRSRLEYIEERIGHYVTCLQQECAEIRDWTRWKEWSTQLGNKDPIIEAGSLKWLHEIRIEVVDMICFLLNLAAWLGMFTPQIILRYYMEKVKENHARQDSGKY